MRSWILVAVLTVLSGYIYKASNFRPAHNFHVVDEGRFYRSAQPTASELKDEVARLHIRTVINLRGRQPGEWWYDAEEKTLAGLGVKLINIGFSTENVQDRQDWMTYLDTLANAERPILVHCRSGADRTGEASAIYAMDYMGRTRAQAIQEQMSFRSWHISLFHPAKRAFVEHYGGRHWMESYNPCSKEFRRYARHSCPLVTEDRPALPRAPHTETSARASTKSAANPHVENTRHFVVAKHG